MEHEKFSKPTVNSIKMHLKDVERLEGISSSSTKRILKQIFIIGFKSLSKVEKNTITTQNVRKFFES